MDEIVTPAVETTIVAQTKVDALCELFQVSPTCITNLGGENHFRNEVNGETYLVLTDDEANDMFLEDICKYPHKVAIDTIAPFLPDNVNADALERIKNEVKVEIYDEIVIYLLECGDIAGYTDEVFEKYEHSFFLSCDDNEVCVGDYNIYRV